MDHDNYKDLFHITFLQQVAFDCKYSLNLYKTYGDTELSNIINRQVGLPYWLGSAESGTWTASTSSNVPIVTRTANVATEYYNFHMPIASPTKMGHGVKLKAINLTYSINSADTTNDDLEFHIIRTSLGAQDAATTATVLAGNDNADYDSSHNTKALRLDSTGAPELHNITITIPVVEQKYVADGENYFVRIKVKDAGTANLAFILTGAIALFDNID